MTNKSGIRQPITSPWMEAWLPPYESGADLRNA